MIENLLAQKDLEIFKLKNDLYNLTDECKSYLNKFISCENALKQIDQNNTSSWRNAWLDDFWSSSDFLLLNICFLPHDYLDNFSIVHYQSEGVYDEDSKKFSIKRLDIVNNDFIMEEILSPFYVTHYKDLPKFIDCESMFDSYRAQSDFFRNRDIKYD